MIPVISFIGRSGSGKTTLLEKVVAELKNRGLKVVVIKHSPHSDLNFDTDGKDSQRFTAAGAEEVVISGPREIVSIKKTDRDLSPDEIVRFLSPDTDLVLTEGYKHEDNVKIEVHRKLLGAELLAKPDELLAVITDERLGVDVPQFDVMKNNTVEIADLIEKWLSTRSTMVIELLIS